MRSVVLFSNLDPPAAGRHHGHSQCCPLGTGPTWVNIRILLNNNKLSLHLPIVLLLLVLDYSYLEGALLGVARLIRGLNMMDVTPSLPVFTSSALFPVGFVLLNFYFTSMQTCRDC